MFLRLEVGDGAFVDEDLGGEFGALVLLGAGDGGGFLIAGLPLLTVGGDLGEALSRSASRLLSLAMVSSEAVLSAAVLFDEGGVLVFEGGDFFGEFLGFLLGDGLGGLGVGGFGLGGAQLEHDGAELLAELDGGIGFLGGVEREGEEEEEKERDAPETVWGGTPQPLGWSVTVGNFMIVRTWR